MIDPPRQLVCLGGTLCDNRLFEPLLDQLYRPAIIWPHSSHARISAAAAALLETVSGSFVWVGFSLGGFIALEALRMAPERTLAVILLSGNALPDEPQNAEMRRRDVDIGRRDGLSNFMRNRAETLVSCDSAGHGNVVDLIAAMAESEGHEVHARQAEMNIHRPDFRSVIRQSNRPILALAGEDDRVCPRERYLALENMKTVSLKMIEGAGHFIPLEAPAHCANRINAFLKDNDL